MYSDPTTARSIPPRESRTATTLSFILPTLNEAAIIRERLKQLQPFRDRGHEVLLIDGGSSDDTVLAAADLVDYTAVSAPGRAMQMNQGARKAQGEVLVFVHADTTLPVEADTLVIDALAHCKRHWGRFDVCIEGSHWAFRLISVCMNWRSRLSGIATGDQAIFVSRKTFMQIRGFPDIPLMEDIALSKRLKQLAGRPLCISTKATTSGRRWEQNGILKTILLMWTLRLGYWLGVNPARLASAYGYTRRKT